MVQNTYFYCPPAQRRQRTQQLCPQHGRPPDGFYASLPGRRPPKRIVTCQGLVDGWAVRVRGQLAPHACVPVSRREKLLFSGAGCVMAWPARLATAWPRLRWHCHADLHAPICVYALDGACVSRPVAVMGCWERCLARHPPWIVTVSFPRKRSEPAGMVAG